MVFSVFSLRRSNFWQGHGSSGSYSKATDSIYVASSISFSKATDSISSALRGGREPNRGSSQVHCEIEENIDGYYKRCYVFKNSNNIDQDVSLYPSEVCWYYVVKNSNNIDQDVSLDPSQDVSLDPSQVRCEIEENIDQMWLLYQIKQSTILIRW